MKTPSHLQSRAAGLTLAAALAVVGASCASTSESASSQSRAENVGVYSPPPVGLAMPRVGVPAMEVGSSASAGMENLASDQLATLLVRTDRFDAIERNQLEKLLEEQDLEGIVAADEMAGMSQVRGVDYLLVGKITNMRVKETRTDQTSGFAQIANIATDEFRGGVGGLDIDSSKVEIKVECGVDLRLVDPTTGSTLEANFSEYTRTDKASAMGIQVLGIGAKGDANIEMSDDDRGLILRLALDDAIRKMLPRLDRKLMKRTRELESSSDA